MWSSATRSATRSIRAKSSGEISLVSGRVEATGSATLEAMPGQPGSEPGSQRDAIVTRHREHQGTERVEAPRMLEGREQEPAAHPHRSPDVRPAPPLPTEQSAVADAVIVHAANRRQKERSERQGD